jgi:PHP family Zn ribbon phosphoesterase
VSRDREYNQAHNKGMTVDQRRKWVRDQASKETGLPFNFSKPPRRVGRQWYTECEGEDCEKYLLINRTTYLVVCSRCGHYNRMEKGESDAE